MQFKCLYILLPSGIILNIDFLKTLIITQKLKSEIVTFHLVNIWVMIENHIQLPLIINMRNPFAIVKQSEF